MTQPIRLLPSLTLVLAFVATAASPARPLAQLPPKGNAIAAHSKRVTIYRLDLARAGETPRVIVDGRVRIIELSLGTYGELDRYALARFGFVAQSEVQMIATAYTAHDYGCSGITATGRPAGRGIVAVDPRVIPLGSRLYIPGYGFALAGDTGGAILGNRVDLGFTSYDDAIRFGRREVTVYRLK